MAIRVVQLGTPGKQNEGLRIGTVRRPPRGVRKGDYARLNYFDVWLPELAPSPDLLRWATSEPFTPKRWAVFKKRYQQEMREPEAKRLLMLLAALSSQTDFSVGCYCGDESRCHRSVLMELLIAHGARVV